MIQSFNEPTQHPLGGFARGSFLSAVYPLERFSDPPAISGLLTQDIGPYCDSCKGSSFINDWYDDEAFLDEFHLPGMWQARAALELTARYGCTGAFTKWHAFDRFYHLFFHQIDPAHPLHVPAAYGRYEKVHQGILRIADEMAGAILDAMDRDTTLVVVSDHGLNGFSRHINVNNWLVKEGYQSVRFDAEGKPEIDWARTRVVLAPFVQLWVNLKGRDPHGIVEPGKEYEGLCRELADGLRGWGDPDTGKCVFEEVFHISERAPYGLGGPRDGDVRIHTTPGYSLYRLNVATPDGVLIKAAGPPYTGDHGSESPTAGFGRGSMRGIFFGAGAGIRSFGRRSRPISPCDIVPTLCQIIGVAPPRNADGDVLKDILE